MQPSGKRKRDFDDGEDFGEEGVAIKSSDGYRAGGGIYRADAQRLDFRQYGAEYKAKVLAAHLSLVTKMLCFFFLLQKAKGDVKKKGRPDPYAYIPLNRQKLNRRKRAKMTGEFSGIMKKAIKGSAAGAKHRRKT